MYFNVIKYSSLYLLTKLSASILRFLIKKVKKKVTCRQFIAAMYNPYDNHWVLSVKKLCLNAFNILVFIRFYKRYVMGSNCKKNFQYLISVVCFIISQYKSLIIYY